MLYELEAFRENLDRSYVAADITMVVALRLHQNNPWILNRIRSLGGYYEPAPAIIVVDLGSQHGYQEQVAQACLEAHLTLLRVEDTEVFSLSKARNCGAVASDTDLLFFSDIDCFGDRDLFARLANFGNSMGLGARFDQIVNLPVYHLGEETTAAFFRAPYAAERAQVVARAMCESVISSPGGVAEYVDPHSNFFLIRKDFFDYMGGCNEAFRGHGSEDFEFLLRLSMYSLQFPTPDEPTQDLFRPRAGDHYGAKPYSGFRRLFELMALPAQLAGLRIAHLYHERGKDTSGWYENNDWARTRFFEQVDPVLATRANLIDYDWMPRKRRALVLIKQEAHADVFFPLRLAGYKLTAAHEGDPASLERAALLIENAEVDAVAVFNPYMKSHQTLKPLFDAARAKGLRTIVFERGALPESWYYGPDMSYADPDFAELELCEEEFSDAELALTDAYAARLRSGVATLEANGDYAETRARLESFCAGHRKICLIPLQLRDDVAVTQFNEGYPKHDAFMRDLKRVVARHPDVLFLVKTHPLSKEALDLVGRNVVDCDEYDNIHALIDLSHAVVCYNSGVGLLALIHQRRLVTVGNAFYNLPGLGARATSLDEAVKRAFGVDNMTFHTQPVRLLLAWLLTRKYSFFRGESVVHEFAARKAHGYKNLLWYQLNLDGKHASLRAGLDMRVAAKCHATAQLGVGAELAARGHHRGADLQKSGRYSSHAALTRLLPSPKFAKFVRDPKRFLEDSRYGALRMIAQTLPEAMGTRPSVRKLHKLIRDPVVFLEDARSPTARLLGQGLARALSVI